MINMVIEEIMKTLKYEIERQIKEIKEKKQTFVIYLPFGLIVADNYEFAQVLKQYIIPVSYTHLTLPTILRV